MREGPLAQPRRRHRRRVWAGRSQRAGRWVRWGGGVFAFGVIALAVVWLARRADRPDPAIAWREGIAAQQRGNYSAARNHFIAAARSGERSGAALLRLARVYLLLGDGLAAQGALDRAIAAGVPVGQTRALHVAALAAQGDNEGAIAAAAALGDDPVAQRSRAQALAQAGRGAEAVGVLQAVLARAPQDAAAWTLLGQTRLDLGDVAGATDAAARAIAGRDAPLAALVLAGDVVRSRYGAVAALPWYEAALKRDAYFYPALIDYAGTLGDVGRHGDAVAAARRALAARNGSPPALYLLAVVAARAGNMALADDLLDRTGGALNGLPGGLLLSGGIDYGAGRYEQAAIKWRALLARQPMNLQARRLLGAALLRTGDAAGALDTLRPIALRRDADSYTLGLVARAFEAQGQRGWAARFLDRAAAMPSSPAAPFGQDDDPAALATAVAENRADPRAMVSLVRGRLEAGQGGAALVEAQALARQSPGAPAAHVLIGDVLFATGRAGAAAASYARAADLRFDRATMLRLIEARLISGDRRGAADALALYLAQHPADIAARRALANAQLMTDPASARETLDPLLIELGGRDALLLALVARARVAAGDAGAALAPARAAYRLQPMNATIADAYGLALLATGDAGGARQLLDKAIALAPGRADIRAHRAQAGE